MKRMVLLMTVLLAGCTSSYDVVEPARVTVRQIESRLELASARLPDAGHRSEAFLRQLSEHSDHLSLSIGYGPGAESLANNLKLSAYGFGVSPVRVALVALPGDAKDRLTLDARYLLIQGEECGRLSMAKREQYRFGCTLEYNRSLSLVNPLPGGGR
ncbi:hypothetical protein FCL40_09835 [Ferrimonas sediminicola]|uniref:Lipoprotein n=1 Tax=Ferrimonas sediminicola TaxID=2569538 RepID=A0A4U1BFZ0_9GAMM|nr:hypothetical protein [Ferrimonas sediminicola]TKB48931.1 hypothetical protein FCL40_09835 [Ferrimonas sediminicola]